MVFKRLKWKGFREATAILFFASCLAFGFNAIREHSLPLPGNTKAVDLSPGAVNEPDGSNAIGDISIEEAVRLFEEGVALFVDARSETDYQAGHIEGAVNIPDLDFENHIGSFLEKTAAETVLITYCEGESCALSKSLAEKLSLAGFENIFHLKNGWGQWKERGLPIAIGPE
ncbi:MAG: rhodanese-like domain-containing protein [Desulfobacterales bacterium]|jgi:rhodanese-related sulfurtransferase